MGNGKSLGAGRGSVGRMREFLVDMVVEQEQIAYALELWALQRGRLNQDTTGWEGNICSQCG